MRALRRPSFVRPLVWAVCGALFTSAALAQNDRSLAKDDLAFAREIARNGYPDLAGDFLDVFEKKHKANRDDMLAVEALRLDLREESAYREPEARKRLELLEALVKEKESFAADHSDLPLVEDMISRLPDLYRNVGELTTSILHDEPDAKDADALKKRSRRLFERALLDLHERVAALSERRSNQDLDAIDAELERQYMLASYNLARTHYFHALVLDAKSEEQRENVDQALAVLLDFQLDFADSLLCYEGYIYEGLCHQLVGSTDAALESFDSAIRLRESYERAASGVYALPPEAADLISNAVHQKIALFSAKPDPAQVIATAEDFLATIPDALRTYRGATILIAAAEAYREKGDAAAVEAAAKRLIEVDPRGPGGERGRLLLREGGATQIVATDSLKLAEAAAGRGEFDRAIELAQEAALLANGTKNEQDAGAQAGVLIGALYAQKGQMHEAAAAWDTAAERYAKGKDAPECLWRAINAYLTLGGQEKTNFYRDRARARMNELSARYREHPYASQAAFIEGQELEQERRYAAAAELYERIATQGAGSEEALYRAGQAWSKAAREAFSAKKKQQDAPALAAKAEERLRNSIPALETAAAGTLDRNTQERLLSLAFSARVGLANLYMLDGVGRAADALPLFADAENRFAKDPTKLATSRRVRMKALQLSGRVDDAIAILDACLRADPALKGMAAACASLAQALDARASEVEHDDPLSAEVERLRRRAAEYYDLALKSESPGPDGLEDAEVELISNRLLALALQFNGVPADAETFIDAGARRPAPDAFEQALHGFEALAKRRPSVRTDILIGRTLAFLGRWPDAAARYGELFAREPYVDLEKREIAPDKLRSRPELMPAALEWAACERQTGAPKSDADRLGRASAILEALVLVAKPASRSWWQAKYYQMRVLLDRGEYDVAAIALRSIRRNYPEFDESQYGVREKFLALDEELARLGHK
ncbi:MAG: hypothetical protein IT453_13850 [Planctomycetes bacterium]|nr:hypothetical protein [Planctomycetota bacterium]